MAEGIIIERKNKPGLLRRLIRSSSLILIGMITSPLPTFAEPAEYGVNLDAGIVFTDNLFLFQDGAEVSEVVYIISPEFYYTRNDERLQANLRYKPEALFFTDFSEENDVFHILDANLTAALARDRFYIFLQAANFQTIVTPNGQFPTTNIPVSENRVDSRTLEVKPYWTEKIGSADMLMEFAYRAVDYADERFQSSDERRGFFRIDNIRQEQGLTWGLEYQIRNMEYEEATPWEFQRASAELGFWFSSVARVFGVGGAETAFDNLVESNLDEGFWEAGIQYKPNRRVDIELAFGKRSYGDSYRANILLNSRRGELSFNYYDGPESRGDIAFDRDPIFVDDNDDNLGNALDRPGDSDRFIRRLGEVRAAYKLAKSEASLRVFVESRILRTTADGIPLEDEDYAGVAFRWEWRAGSKTTIGFGADYVERNDEVANDDISRLQVDYAYRFSLQTSIRLEVANSRQRGKDSSAFDYVENQARLLLRTEF